LGVIDNGLNLLNVSPFLQGVVKGFVILFAVFIDRNSDLMRGLWKMLGSLRPKGPSSRRGGPNSPNDGSAPPAPTEPELASRR
jgi:ribose transport system permease protein